MIIASALLLVTIVTGWGGASYSWTGGNVNLGGGCVSGFYTDGSTVPPFLGQGWHVHFDWSDPPSWSHSVDSTIYGGTYRAFRWTPESGMQSLGLPAGSVHSVWGKGPMTDFPL